jgi:sugar phosphate permease
MKETADQPQNKVAKSRGLFPGWWLIIYGGIMSGIGHGFFSYGFSVFFKDVASELQLNRSVTSLASGLGRLEGGFSAPVVGWLSDKFGPRWVIFTGLCFAAIGMMLMYFIHSATLYFIAWGLLTGFGLNIGLTVAIDQSITNWFVRKRGLAQGIKFALLGVGALIVVPVVTWLVTSFGWRTTCLLWGAVVLVLAPLAIFAVKQKRPEEYGLMPDGATLNSGSSSAVQQGLDYASGIGETEFTFKQAFRTRAYWMLTLAYAGFGLVMGGFTIHIIPFLTDMGLSASTASGLMSMMIFFTIPSRFFSGIIADRTRKSRLQYLVAVSFAVAAIGLGTFLLSRNMPSIYVLLVTYGLSSGAVTPLVIMVYGRYFGRKAFGSIFGSAMAFNSIAGLIAPVYAGWVYDTSGSYATALTVFAIMAAAGAVVVGMIKEPQVPASGAVPGMKSP